MDPSLDSVISTFSGQLFECLRQMESEACADVQYQGKPYPTGLYWYEGHWNSDPLNRRAKGTELAWTRRLATLIPARTGMKCSEQVYYPGSKKTCDLVVDVGCGRTLWIEVKPSFRSYWRKRGRLPRYEELLFSSVGGSVALDVKKLETISTGFVGVLLVGFDASGDTMDADVQKLRDMTGLGNAPWTESSDRWVDPYRSGERVNCFFWWRPA